MTCFSPKYGVGASATDGSPASREKLLLAATELFIASEHPERSDVRQFQELCLQLIDETPVSERRRIAQLLAANPHAPSDVLAQLAADEDPQVAYPALQHTQILPEPLLADVIERGPDKLRATVARRAGLSPSLLRALAVHTSPRTAIALIEDGDLPLSPDVLDVLCRKPAVMKVIGPGVAKERLLSSDQLITHYLTLDTANRHLALAAAELQTLAEIAQKGRSSFLRPSFKPDLLHRIEVSTLTHGATAFARQIAYAFKLDPDLAAQITVDDSGEPQAICLKALGMSENPATAILIKLVSSTVEADEMHGVFTLYETISHATAQTFLSTWRAASMGAIANTDKRAKHQPIYQETGGLRGHGGRDLSPVHEYDGYSLRGSLRDTSTADQTPKSSDATRRRA